MKLSTKGRYGARAVLELALRHGSGPVMVREIAASQDISGRYLEHILNSLRASGLVKSTRGAKGGYELSRAPSAITIGEIITALEGPADIVSYTSNESDCPKISYCVTREIWDEVKVSIETVLNRITLENMVTRHHELQKLDSNTIPDYII